MASSASAMAAASRLKRTVDIIGSLLALVVLAPLLAFIGLAVVLDSPGPALFRQLRGGLRHQPFPILKFRTMAVAKDDSVVVAHATRADPRVTRLGRFLRRSSLDELPQLINVLRGEMSLVGPRPHALDHDCLYGGLLPDYEKRFSVRPGLTGLAQVSGFRGEIHTIEDMAGRVACDVAYAENWRLALDARLILRTAQVVLWDERAY